MLCGTTPLLRCAVLCCDAMSVTCCTAVVPPLHAADCLLLLVVALQPLTVQHSIQCWLTPSRTHTHSSQPCLLPAPRDVEDKIEGVE